MQGIRSRASTSDHWVTVAECATNTLRFTFQLAKRVGENWAPPSLTFQPKVGNCSWQFPLSVSLRSFRESPEVGQKRSFTTSADP